MEGMHHDNFDGHDHCASLVAERDELRRKLGELREACKPYFEETALVMANCPPNDDGDYVLTINHEDAGALAALKEEK